MSSGKNTAASVKDRLLKLSRESRSDFNLLLLRFIQERLLYRISKSEHQKNFVLKGAALFTLWAGNPHRATKDTDLLSFGSPDPEAVKAIFQGMLSMPASEDGLIFDAQNINTSTIRKHASYDGVRLNIPVTLGTAKTKVQVDVGFGDSTVPEPIEAEFPTLLGHPAPTIRAYRAETVVAEKFDAMLTLGMLNSRMKDY